jgi:general L-amino acid transport system substrate-binding protein
MDIVSRLLTLLGRFLLAWCCLHAAALTASAAAPKVLERIRDRGYINCGVGENTPGFSQVNARGLWTGFEVEFCSALAVAVFGRRDAVKFRALAPNDRFKSLKDGEIDVLLRTTAWTLSRDSDLGMQFVDPLFYDGQGFLVPRSHAIDSVLELSGASICVLPGSTNERSLIDFFNQRKMRYQLVSSDHWADLVRSYAAGGCTVLTGDVSLLAFERSRLRSPTDHFILPDLISKEPLAPAVATGDEEWFTIVRWVRFALIAAEEFGVTSANAEGMRDATSLDVRRFLGLESNLGQALGLARDWTFQVIKQTGNYGELFERTVGAGSPLGLERGLNKLWTKGGLMYAAPFR